MATRGPRAVRDAILISYADNLIDDEEFVLLYDANISREVYPYWKFQRFDLDELNDVQCKTEFRFAKNDVIRLTESLQIPEKIVCSQRTICTGLEATCILLKRLAFPCRYTDILSCFDRNQSEVCLIFNTILDMIYSDHHHRVESWNQPFLQPACLQNYADVIHQRGAPLDNCFGFIDGTVCKIYRPTVNQRVVYNGHKRVHGLKFQSLALPNGLIGKA